MPKGEIVGIKLVLPSVTTLSNISDSTDLPGNTVSTGQYSVYRAMQCLPSSGFHSIYRVQYSWFFSGHRV